MGPAIVISDVLGGAPRSSLPSHLTFFGRILGLPQASTQVCTEIVGRSDGACANPPAGWGALPNGDWTFDAASMEWRAMFVANQFPAGTYKQFARNSATAAMAPSITFTLTGPVATFSTERDGAAATMFRTSQAIHGRVEGLGPDHAQSCVEIIGTTDGACGNPPGGWTNLPNSDWAYDSAAMKWRATLAANTIPAGRYREFFRDSQTGAHSLPLDLTVTNACNWTAFVAGPVTPPSDPCNQGNAGATQDYMGYTWTCQCQ